MLVRKLAVGPALGLAAALLALLLSLAPFLETIELKTYDWRVRVVAQPDAPSDDIVMVHIDDDTIRRLEPLAGRWPWPRLFHSELIRFLARGPATLVVYDVLFTEADIRRFTVGEEEWTGAKSDEDFATAIAKAGNVVLAADARLEGLRDESKQIKIPLDDIPSLNEPYNAGDCVERRPLLVPPIPALAKAARAIGHSYMVLDSDGPARRSVPFVRVDNRDIPSLSSVSALLAQKFDARAVRAEPPGLRIGDTVAPLIGCRALIPYRGPLMGKNGVQTFRTYSFYDLFLSEQQLLEGVKPDVDPQLFKDRIVVVGATASGTYDVFAVPFGSGMPGAQIHANVVDGLLRSRTIAPVAPYPGALATVLCAVVIGVIGAFVSPWVLAAIAAAMSATVVWFSVILFENGLWAPVTQTVMAIGLAFVGQLAWQYFVEGREKRQVKRLFSRYVPKDVYEQLMADPTRAALGGRRRTMTVLFSDVRGFTALSEKASPEDVVNQLNEYFSRMVLVLFEHRGTLDKFVGDMVMGLFGAPLDDDDHAEHAVQAALAMTRALDELNAAWVAQGKPSLDIGIGISTGDMVAGNIGSETIMSYTVIGDTVNLGARLESLNKDYGTRIIISEATQAALKGRYDIHPLGEVTVKGKSRPVAIYEVRST